MPKVFHVASGSPVGNSADLCLMLHNSKEKQQEKWVNSKYPNIKMYRVFLYCQVKWTLPFSSPQIFFFFFKLISGYSHSQSCPSEFLRMSQGIRMVVDVALSRATICLCACFSYQEATVQESHIWPLSNLSFAFISPIHRASGEHNDRSCNAANRAKVLFFPYLPQFKIKFIY